MRLFEFNRKLHVVSFLVEGVEDQDVVKSGNGGDDGGDDNGNDDGLDDNGRMMATMMRRLMISMMT